MLAIRSARGRRPSPQPWTGLRRRQGSGGVIGPIAKASNTNSRARPLLLPLPSSEARKPSPLLVNFSPSAGRGRRDRLRFRPLKLPTRRLAATVPTHHAWGLVCAHDAVSGTGRDYHREPASLQQIATNATTEPRLRATNHSELQGSEGPVPTLCYPSAHGGKQIGDHRAPPPSGQSITLGR